MKQFPASITVTIPFKKWDIAKYMKDNNNKTCYLEDALIKKGFINPFVGGSGDTTIRIGERERMYKPTEPFHSQVLRINFGNEVDTIVTLEPLVNED